jgi:hypothetical protein
MYLEGTQIEETPLNLHLTTLLASFDLFYMEFRVSFVFQVFFFLSLEVVVSDKS